MHMPRPLFMLLVACVAGSLVTGHATAARAAGPRNPYSSFNLSGINWGSQQWERDQRAGRVVWPYYNVPGYNVPGRTSSGRSNVSVGGVNGGGGMVIQQGTYRTAPRAVRRGRR